MLATRLVVMEAPQHVYYWLRQCWATSYKLAAIASICIFALAATLLIVATRVSEPADLNWHLQVTFLTYYNNIWTLVQDKRKGH